MEEDSAAVARAGCVTSGRIAGKADAVAGRAVDVYNCAFRVQSAAMRRRAGDNLRVAVHGESPVQELNRAALVCGSGISQRGAGCDCHAAAVRVDKPSGHRRREALLIAVQRDVRKRKGAVIYEHAAAVLRTGNG